MKMNCYIKKCLLVILAFIVLVVFCGCGETKDVFTQKVNGNLVSASGDEYEHLANEGVLYCLGNLVFQGSVSGEKKTSRHMGVTYQTGMFSIENDDTNNVLVRYLPNNEWASIYRKASLPPFDFSVDNCTRLELVLGAGDIENDVIHTTCGEGIKSSSEIAEFLSEVRLQKDPREAGLVDLITKPNGMLENCYTYGVVYGFFEDEPNLAICMSIISYNDLGYSITIEEKMYVLPDKWLQRLKNS